MQGRVVLFVCTGNSCRSQMAEALLRKRAGDGWTVLSAGLDPQGVHPITLKVLQEVGVDTSMLHSKSLFDMIGHVHPDFLITVCSHAEANCPHVWPGKTTRLSWPFDDPARARGSEHTVVNEFRRVRTAIDRTIIDWLDTLPTMNGSASSPLR